MSCGTTETTDTTLAQAGGCPGTRREARVPGVPPHGSPLPATVGPRSPDDTGGTVPNWVAAQRARVLVPVGAQRWSLRENSFPSHPGVPTSTCRSAASPPSKRRRPGIEHPQAPRGSRLMGAVISQQRPAATCTLPMSSLHVPWGCASRCSGRLQPKQLPGETSRTQRVLLGCCAPPKPAHPDPHHTRGRLPASPSPRSRAYHPDAFTALRPVTGMQAAL